MLKAERYPHLKITDPEVYDLICRQLDDTISGSCGLQHKERLSKIIN